MGKFKEIRSARLQRREFDPAKNNREDVEKIELRNRGESPSVLDRNIGRLLLVTIPVKDETSPTSYREIAQAIRDTVGKNIVFGFSTHPLNQQKRSIDPVEVSIHRPVRLIIDQLSEIAGTQFVTRHPISYVTGEDLDPPLLARAAEATLGHRRTDGYAHVAVADARGVGSSVNLGSSDTYHGAAFVLRGMRHEVPEWENIWSSPASGADPLSTS